MIRRPPRATLDRSSAASDVYKRQDFRVVFAEELAGLLVERNKTRRIRRGDVRMGPIPVSYTHLRAHETVLDLVCSLLLEKKTRIIRPIVVINLTSNHQ